MKSAHLVPVLQENIARVIKGKSRAIELTVVALLARGHLLLEDVPGVGKTTLAHSLARFDQRDRRGHAAADLVCLAAVFLVLSAGAVWLNTCTTFPRELKSVLLVFFDKYRIYAFPI